MIEIMIRVIVLVLALVIGAMTYVRLAPTDVARWHQLDPVTTAGDAQEPGGFKAVRQITAAPEEVLTRLDAIARATPRTRPIAGSIAERMMTYQTRSLIWGFPDHTTIAVQGDLLVIHGRLRFGQSDMAVNRARVLDWLDQLGPLTAPP